MRHILILEADARNLFEKKAYDEAIEKYRLVLDLKKELLGHEHADFLKTVDALVGIFERLRQFNTATALMIWALNPEGAEPYPIYKLDTSDDPQVDNLWVIIQREIAEKDKMHYVM